MAYLDRVREFYAPFIKAAKADSPHASGWANRGDQLLRFVTICGMLDFNKEGGVSCLDVGCGVGDLKQFLGEFNPDADIDYTGIDVCPEMIEKAASLRKGRFLVQSLMDMDTQSPDHQVYDYIICNGTLNSPGYESQTLVMRLIQKMYDLSNIGVAFNFLDSCSAREQIPGLVYQDGGSIYRECKKVCDRVVLLSDYSIAEGDTTIILSNEAYLDKEEQARMSEAYEQQEERRAAQGSADPAADELARLNSWTCPVCGTSNHKLKVNCTNLSGCVGVRPDDLDKPDGPDLKIIT